MERGLPRVVAPRDRNAGTRTRSVGTRLVGQLDARQSSQFPWLWTSPRTWTASTPPSSNMAPRTHQRSPLRRGRRGRRRSRRPRRSPRRWAVVRTRRGAGRRTPPARPGRSSRTPRWSSRSRWPRRADLARTLGSTALARPATTVGRSCWASRMEASTRSARPVSGHTQASSHRASAGSDRSIGERSIPTRAASAGSRSAIGGSPPVTSQLIRTVESAGPVAPWRP